MGQKGEVICSALEKQTVLHTEQRPRFPSSVCLSTVKPVGALRTSVQDTGSNALAMQQVLIQCYGTSVKL